MKASIAQVLVALSMTAGLASAGCPGKVTPGDYCCRTKCRFDTSGGCCLGCSVAGGRGSCWSEWNDGATWNYHCDGEMNGDKLKEMGYNCWGNFGGEFWCQC